MNAVLAFLIKAAGLYFLIILPFNRFAKKLAPPAPAPSPSELYLKEIRDALVKR